MIRKDSHNRHQSNHPHNRLQSNHQFVLQFKKYEFSVFTYQESLRLTKTRMKSIWFKTSGAIDP